MAAFLRIALRARSPEPWIERGLFALFTLICIAWTLVSGKDLNFDQLNYHFFIAHSLLHDRLSEDFVAANGQSYLNPLAYVPFYWMVSHGWHSVLIASVLAVFHSLNAILAFLIAKAALPASPERVWLAALGALLALLAPVFLIEVGTTFADAFTSVFALAAVLISMTSGRGAPSQWWKSPALLSGILMGAAGALKLSNLVFAPALLASLLVVQPGFVSRLRATIWLGIGGAIGFAIAHGYWSWQLWTETGNPMFPWLRNYFWDDLLPRDGANLERFLPRNALESLTLPFRMMIPRSWIYLESASPDLRFAALVLLASVVLLTWLRRRKTAEGDHDASARSAVALGAFFVCAYGLWQWTTGNGRYGLVVSLLCGPMLVVVANALLRARTAAVVLALLALLQFIHLQSGSLRWSTGEWTASWYQEEVPKRLKTEPFLYVSVGNNTNSYVFPYLAAGSAFTNPMGQISFDLEGPGSRELNALIGRYRGRVRVLAPGPTGTMTSAKLAGWVSQMDSRIARLNFSVDGSDCDVIRTEGPPEIGQDFDSKKRVRNLVTCRVVERPFALASERASMTTLMHEVATWCPKLFKPAYTMVERSSTLWIASYPSTDSRMIVRDGVIYGSFARANADLRIATVEDWRRGMRPACSSFPDRPREIHTFD